MAKWGFGKWSGPPASVAQPYVIGGMAGPLMVPSPLTKWGPAGYPTPLRTGAAQFKIAWNKGVPDFRVTSFKIAFLPLNENVGTLPYSSQGQVMTTNNKFTNTGNPLPLNLPAPPAPSRCARSVFVQVANIPFSAYGNAEYFYSNSVGQNALVALSADYSTLYVGVAINAFADSAVIKIDVATGSVLATSATQSGLQVQKLALSPDGSTLWCYTRQPATVIAYNAATLATLSTTTTGLASVTTAASFDISSDGSLLLLASEDNHGMFTIATSGLAVTNWTIAGSTAIDYACFKPGTTHIYLTNSNAGDTEADNIFEYSAAGSLLTTYTLGLSAPSGDTTKSPFGVHPSTGVIYGCRQDATGTYYVFDPATSTLLGTSVIPPDMGTPPINVQGLAFAKANTATPFIGIFSTLDNKVVVLNQAGSTTVVDLSTFTGLTQGGFGSLVVDGDCSTRVYVYGETLTPDFFADIVTITG